MVVVSIDLQVVADPIAAAVAVFGAAVDTVAAAAARLRDLR